MDKGLFRQISIVVLTAATIIVNLLANALPINGVTTAEISDSIPVFFVPAGYVFAIWGVIYIGLIAFAIYQARAVCRNAEWLDKALIPFAAASVANIAWILFWHHYQLEFSVLAMLLLLVSLIDLYYVLEIGHRKISALTRWMVHIPVSVYLGWISVATIANIAAALQTAGWDGWGISAPMWGAIMVGVATMLGILMLQRRKDIVYALVLIWAFVGIAVKFRGVESIMVAATIPAVLALTALIALKAYRMLLKPVR